MVRKNSGFSLMELMVVIGIIGLLAAIATPNMIDWVSKRKLSTSTRDVHSAIELARITAVRRNVNATVALNYTTHNLTVTAGGNTVRVVRLAAGVRFIQPGTSPLGTSFTFNSQGIPSVTGNVLIRDGKHTDKQVQVSAGGNVRIVG